MSLVKPLITALIIFVLLSSLSYANHGRAVGIGIKDLADGKGPVVTKHSWVTVHYTGLLSDGTIFESTYDLGKPRTFQVGVDKVVHGLEHGLLGMRPGGKRILIIPPAYAYGKKGDGGKIPPSSTLRFDVELIDTLPPKYRNLSNTQLREGLEQGVVLIDIRRAEEWEGSGVIEGSHLITAFDEKGRFVESFLGQLAKVADKATPINLISRSGNRSSIIANFLTTKAGFANVGNVYEGINKWISEGNPVTK